MPPISATQFSEPPQFAPQRPHPIAPDTHQTRSPDPEFPNAPPSFHGLAGRSPAIRRLISQLRRLAPHLATVTIHGEPGTGTTTIARALHAASPAAIGPFRPCIATHFFTSDSQLGWSNQILAEAHNGTLVLDRIQELTTAQRSTLARFLHWLEDSREIAAAPPLFAAQIQPIAVPRQLIFTAIDPPDQGSPAASASQPTIQLHIPPLRERREDIPLLAQIFIHRFARTYGKQVRGLGPGAVAPLLRHPWHGNVRELESVITHAALQTDTDWIRPTDLPPLSTAAPKPPPKPSPDPAAVPSPLDQADLNLDRAIRSHVQRALDRVGGNKLRAAQLLGISRSTLYRILDGKP